MAEAKDADAELKAKRAQWRDWAHTQFSGDEAQLEAVADAALRAALGGASSQEAAAAAREVAVRAGATPVAGQADDTGHSAPPAKVPPSGGASLPQPTAPQPRWYRRPLVLATVAAIVVVLIGLAIWGLTRSSGPSGPETSVVPATSTTKHTTKRPKKSTSSTSPTPGAKYGGIVTITIPSASP